MPSKKVPYEQALKLYVWRELHKKVLAMVHALQMPVEVEHQRLRCVHDFVGIPALEIVEIGIDEGTDENGLVEIRWTENVEEQDSK